jgi:type II secretory pathway pseudopilin PulG
VNGSLALATFRQMQAQGCQPTGHPFQADGGERGRSRAAPRRANRGSTGWSDGRCGFTIIDVLVSVAVIAVLISILMPSLSMVRETTRRLVCASNTRQIGLGLAMYAEDYAGILPPTRFDSLSDAHRLTTVRVSDNVNDWDGLGWLVGSNYLDAPQVYYCPSHQGENKFSAFADRWHGEPGEILANYHYRGRPAGRSFLTLFSEPTVAIVADGMRTRADFNHGSGANVLHIDLSVFWFADSDGQLVASLPTGGEGDAVAAGRVGQAWQMLDETARPGSGW